MPRHEQRFAVACCRSEEGKEGQCGAGASEMQDYRMPPRPGAGIVCMTSMTTRQIIIE